MMDNETRLIHARCQAREELIAYVQAPQSDSDTGRLQETFNELFEASECAARKLPEIEVLSRIIVAREVVIDSIHALSHEQVQRADTVAMQLANHLIN